MTDAAPTPTTFPTPVHLNAPLAHIGAWTHYLMSAEIPVLAGTAAALEELRAIEDDVDANMLTAVIQSDPLMTLKLMTYVASLRRPGNATETESVSAALVLMGISPFFRHFGPQQTVEAWLENQPEALQALQVVLRHAERAGQFALAFAVHRGDTDATLIHQAAFLYDFAEMLMWLHAPALMLKIQAAQAADSTLRSSVIQREVLGIDINDMRQSLMKLWRLPEQLMHVSDGRHAEQTNVKSVLLAVRVARHSANGWDNAALPDDYADIAALLNGSLRIVPAFLLKVDHPMLEATTVNAPLSRN